uniref:Uncharacterized protein n=1 Tax=Ralstonia solanacearum TaxID=305 RepID=A0A0S4XGP0_RALSL|nr:protein of unknown function [Ralstonia solanacearum]CUV33378.1 protein of unknown function [Ralstonia solanacearum]CUV40428.1 protein of unknown function [Ralstonia solanacearum]CUV62363.1 protein of unknown function [Ralstonia solanacearum]
MTSNHDFCVRQKSARNSRSKSVGTMCLYTGILADGELDSLYEPTIPQGHERPLCPTSASRSGIKD